VAPPLVTVVVPTYNRPHYLREAIASVIAQQEHRWEMIVCDDARDERNRSVIDEFSDPRIAYRRNPRRLGIGGNKFAGWQAATGRYVANLDDDDTWEPDFLSTLVPILEADPTITVAFCSYAAMDAAGRIDEELTVRIEERQYRGELAEGRYQPFTRLALVDKAVAISTAALIRRNAVDWHEFPPETDVVADYWLAYLVSRSEGAAYYCPRRLTRYRSHQDSATAERTGWHASYAACFRRFLDDPGLSGMHDVFRRRLADSERRIAIEHVRTGNTAGARSASHRAVATRVDHRTLATLTFAHTGALGRHLAERLARLRGIE
jgi:glycosyltransferase involved in cell wall biosynthesis